MPTQQVQPWAPAIPAIKSGLGELTGLGSKGFRRTYGPNRTAGLNSTLSGAWDATAQRAQQGNPLLGQSQDYISDVLGGKYLTREAPGFSDVLGRTRDMVNANASAGSRYGSGVHQAALGRELGALEYDNYLNERGMQHDAAGMAPEMAAADYFDLNQLTEVGGARQGYDQMLADEAANRYAFDEGGDDDAVMRYLQALLGVGGMGSMSNGPGQGGGSNVNPWLIGAGAATDLASSYLGAGGTFGF
jgi:hypothetical protein